MNENLLNKANGWLEEGVFSKEKSSEEQVAKMVLRILKEKSKEFDVNPKDVLLYLQNKI